MHFEVKTPERKLLVNRRKTARRNIPDRRSMIRFSPGEEMNDRRYSEDRRSSERLNIWNVTLN